ncbi:MAG: hypothetical protein R3B09_20795 [Nannocystaceae bacterium]
MHTHDLRRFALSLALVAACSGDDATTDATATATATATTGGESETETSTATSTSDTGTTADTSSTAATTEDTTSTTTGETTTGETTTGGAAYSFDVTPGFAVPESCIWDPVTHYWYVSNIAPQSSDFSVPDGQGWISRVDPDGAIADAQWVAGLDSPAGLAIASGVLFVNDIQRVHEIDLASGQILLTHEFPMVAAFLNDPAIDATNGIGYTADTFGNTIFQFKVGELGSEAVFVASPELAGPNGLRHEDGTLYVASLVDFDPVNVGPFLAIDVATQGIAKFSDTLGKWDGLERWEGRFLLSDNPSGRLVAFDAEGQSEVLFDLMNDHGFGPAADHGVDEAAGVICVPNLGDSVGWVRTR